jgi:hypothetical protein
MTTLPNVTHTIDDLLDTIVEETMRVRYVWGNYRRLFVEKKEHVEVLNATAPDFFAWIQQLAADAVFLGVARLTDRAVVAGQPNASLDRLLAATEWEVNDPNRWQKYSAKLTAVLAACKDCRKYRHKKLGHNDLSIALKIDPVPVVTVREVDAALDAIAQFVGDVFTELRPNHSYSFRFLNANDHVDRLFAKLCNRKAQTYPDAISAIVRTQEDGALLHCGFCGESAGVWMLSDDIPDGRYLKHWHFDKCSGVVGIETVTVEMRRDDGELRRRTFSLAARKVAPPT